MRTLGKSSQHYKWGRTNETTLGISVDAAGKKYAGGLTGTMKDSDGYEAKAKILNHRNVVVKFKWRYQRQRRVCMHENTTFAYNTNDFRWVPKNTTGGNRIDDTSGNFACGGPGPAYNDHFGLETTVSRNSAVTYAGFFSINNVVLNAKQRDESAQVYTVLPDSGQNAKLCGDDDHPLWASLAKEVSS